MRIKDTSDQVYRGMSINAAYSAICVDDRGIRNREIILDCRFVFFDSLDRHRSDVWQYAVSDRRHTAPTAAELGLRKGPPPNG